LENYFFIDQLELTNFKNYEILSLDLCKGFNCFSGKNGMGKTNILDAINTICLGKSHFSLTDSQLVRDGSDFFRIQALVDKKNKKDSYVVKYKLRGKKQIEKNKIVFAKLADHIGNLPVVFIGPDDIQLLLEGSEERRRFMDLAMVQLDPHYLSQLLTYNKLLEQRNALLKSVVEGKEPDPILLGYYNQQMLQPANYIFEKRSWFIDKLIPLFKQAYALLSNQQEEVDIEYISELKTDSLEFLFQQSLKKDIILQRTTKGVHKDDLELFMRGKSIKKMASQGQLKSFILAMKLAKYQVLAQEQGIHPILLLDDVFDKLDAHRVRQLLDLLLFLQVGQVFITDTHSNRVASLLESRESTLPFRSFEIENAKLIYL
jgi:DNA replication and repair protein RecF